MFGMVLNTPLDFPGTFPLYILVFLQNARIQHYEDGAYITEAEIVNGKIRNGNHFMKAVSVCTFSVNKQQFYFLSFG